MPHGKHIADAQTSSGHLALGLHAVGKCSCSDELTSPHCPAYTTIAAHCSCIQDLKICIPWWTAAPRSFPGAVPPPTDPVSGSTLPVLQCPCSVTAWHSRWVKIQCFCFCKCRQILNAAWLWREQCTGTQPAWLVFVCEVAHAGCMMSRPADPPAPQSQYAQAHAPRGCYKPSAATSASQPLRAHEVLHAR